MMERTPPLDANQKKAVAADGNTVVSAGAGSGKTTVLAERYLRIVREGSADVEEILTLTYTRKAAAEMYERIYGRLRQEAEEPRIKEQLARFDRAQISTLDSFCVQVLRNAPQHFGVRMDFSIGDEQGERLDEETALAFLLDHSDDPALLSFIGLHGFERVWRDCFASLGSSYLHLAEERDFDAIYRRQVEALEAIVEETIARIAATTSQIQALDPGAAKAIADAHAAVVGLPDLAALARSGDYGALGEAAEGLTFSLRVGRASSTEVLRYRELVAEYGEQKEKLLRATFTLDSRDSLRRLFELFGEFQRVLLQRKRASGALSFQDVVEMAVRLLTENHALRRYYKRRYRYLMIDEFQDNNDLQKRLLYLLAEREGEEADGQPGSDRIEPDKLFFVGDEKQSIYRFRGADVAVFRGLSGELEETGGRAIALATNYRSEPLLIDFYNRFFSRIFAEAEADFEARFESLEAGKERSSDAERLASVRLFYKPYEGARDLDEAHSDDAEAFYIASFIKRSVEERSLLVRDGQASRPVTWEDFALLMRTTSNQIRYEKLFRRLNIPYSTQSVRTLFLEAPLNDMYAALTLAVYPDDRSAYAALLRSPFVNLSDTSVVELLLAEGEPFAELPAGVEAMPGEREKVTAGRRLYRHLREAADLKPIASLIDDLWFRFGYRYAILADPSNHPYLEYYDYFRKLAEDADGQGRSLPEFLDLIRPNLGKYEKLPELEVVRDQSGGVQLLTIHKAKGLEFPVVIIANSGNMGRSSQEGSRPYYLSDEFGLTLRVTERGNYFYQAAEEETKEKERAELKRLLYVALTRAKSHLVVSGCHNRQNRNGGEVLLNMVLDVVAPEGVPGAAEDGALAAGFPPIEAVVIPPVSESELLGRVGGSPRSHLDSLLRRYEAAPVVRREARRRSWSASELSGYLWKRLTEPSAEGGLFPELEGGAGGISPAREQPALPSDPVIDELAIETLFGAIVHALLARGVAGGDGRASSREPPERLLRGIPRERLPALLEDAQGLVERFLSSPIGQRAARAAVRYGERAFLYRPTASCQLRGVFDLYFEDDEGRCVLDFKTDRLLQPAIHAAQLHAYSLAAEQLAGGPVKACLFYLRSGELVEVGASLLLPLYRRYFSLFSTGEAASRGSGPPPEVAGSEEWSDGGASYFAAFIEQASIDPQAQTAPVDGDEEEWP